MVRNKVGVEIIKPSRKFILTCCISAIYLFKETDRQNSRVEKTNIVFDEFDVALVYRVEMSQIILLNLYSIEYEERKEYVFVFLNYDDFIS